jgi:transcriptional regulator with PAS, ATPase and Fis domain
MDNWTNEIDIAITVCDKNGMIKSMNDKALSTFKDDGGAKLIGTNVLDCHPEPSRTQLSDMLKNGTKNVYTIEKAGKKKLILQSPYNVNKEYAGFVELSFEIPGEMKHFIRG